MNHLFSRFSSVVLAIIIAAAFTGHAALASRPHFSRGSAQFTSPTTFVGDGRATHLGNYTETGIVAFSPTANPAVLHVEGTLIYTAANGDELHATVSGELNGQTGVVTAEITYDGGTGRFECATGSADLLGQLLAGGAIEVAVSGTIDY